MAISAQTLFHFTRFQHLKSIIQAKAFLPRLSFEPFINDDNTIVAYPMVCFCDIPLSQIYPHAIEYNRNGIGLSKGWGIEKRLNPVFYLQKGSYPSEIIKNATHSIFGQVKKISDSETAVITNNYHLLKKFFDLTAFYKPREGKTWEKEKNQFVKYSGISQKDKITDFYNEREWRYVPDVIRNHSTEHIPVNFWFKDLFYSEGTFKKEVFEKNNNFYKDYKLEFSASDVKYLIVSRVSEIGHLARFISELYNYTNEEKSILTSKIISLKQIQEDF